VTHLPQINPDLNKEYKNRGKVVVEARLSGMKFKDIARVLGVTNARAQQICRKYQPKLVVSTPESFYYELENEY
jgi:DNA-directed RNA polymerase specialized sigma subunit